MIGLWDLGDLEPGLGVEVVGGGDGRLGVWASEGDNIEVESVSYIFTFSFTLVWL